MFRGTNIADMADVLADIRFIQNSNGVHKGFAGNAYDFYQRCKTIYFNINGSRISLYDMIQDMKNPNSKYCLLVSGHSLGAALADVFVGYNLYNDSIDPSNVVAYTFAAPRSVSSSYYYPYKNIINIINEDDWVPTVGGAKRIGTDFSYTPDDTFRQQNYGDQYEEGYGTAWWSSFVNQSVVGGLFHFVSHKLVPVYKAILIQIENNTNDYTSYHTNGDNIWNTTVLIEKNFYSTINGKATIRELRLTDGRLNVKNDLNVSYLCMTHEDAYLLVENDIVITGSWWVISDDTLNAGTVEVKGDFTVTTSSGYYASGNHTTVFSGDKTQTITFSTPSNGCVFKNLVLRNSDVVFATPIYSLTLSHDITITSDSTLEVNNVLNLNGHTLTTQGDVKAYELQSNGGSLNTQSKLTCTKLASVMGGSSIEALDSDLYELKLADGQVNIKNNLSVPYLHMTHEDAYLLVENDIVITGSCWVISDDTLSAGTVEVKGDFTVTTSSSYYATGNHTTVFSGNKKQTISFSKPSNGARFNKLILSNDSSNGCEFISTINVTVLFDHKGNPFTLYNNGIGSAFVDYDGDGMLDNVDPYPTDPNNTPPTQDPTQPSTQVPTQAPTQEPTQPTTQDPTQPPTEEPTKPPTQEPSNSPMLLGDVDGDGTVTIIDATCIQRQLASIPSFAFIEALADTDGDGETTILDATYIQRWLANLPSNDNISKPIK